MVLSNRRAKKFVELNKSLTFSPPKISDDFCTGNRNRRRQNNHNDRWFRTISRAILIELNPSRGIVLSYQYHVSSFRESSRLRENKVRMSFKCVHIGFFRCQHLSYGLGISSCVFDTTKGYFTGDTVCSRDPRKDEDVKKIKKNY